MGNKLIKVGICVAYDWPLLRTSIPRIYSEADIICLAIDKDRKAWSGQHFQFDDEAFHSFIKEIDVDNKIVIYEDNFSLKELNKRQNCNRHRALIAIKLGDGGWHIQIDADEYFLDFKGFTEYLKGINNNPQSNQKPINVCCPFVPLIKKTPKGYLYVNFNDRLPELIPIATNKPDYQRARQNGHFNHITTYHIIHDTWSRSEDELWFKINNWGHASEELEAGNKKLSYYNFWKALDEYNYHYASNFHPADSYTWPALCFCKGTTIEDFIEQFNIPKFPLSSFNVWLRNNRNISRLRFYCEKLIRYLEK